MLPQNLHFKVDKSLPLLRNLHHEVHLVLRLPGNLHFQCTKCRACHKICTSSAQSTEPATKSGTKGAPSAAPATKSAHQDSHRAALPRQFAAKALLQTTSRRFRPRLPSISENEPHVQKSHNSLHRLRNHSTPKATRLPRNLHINRNYHKTTPILHL